MISVKNIDEAFEILKPLVKLIGSALGSNCEVVLHDMRKPEKSIIAIENGHITGRKVGDSSTNLGLEVIRKPEEEGDLLNYLSTSKDGKILKSSSLYFYNDEGQAVSSICINYNITDFMMASNVLNEFIRTAKNVHETFTGDINDVIETLLNEAVDNVGKPVPFMNKEDKMKLLKYLDDKGVFTVKRSMDRVAMFLDISKFTIYNYLEEIRLNKNNYIK
ncbi:transcriptional regulator [Paenibacillus sp. GCM10027626]|uniref:helix-turn-helix transcriptional regulator n=1 Tax=Paenibacillus sp. GCM10027626 TaxID=3273411 RepID=UPI003633C8A0